ncbi:hypothetical protein A0128_06990 [Leptospira tipperaryensis]|uniref:Uncharacterized protein n=1 Tax=Leptospira tipperaryensis TaxID=2564040 RepID=A0A1D7UVP6_9LEPT|nr:hypothetical protein [Leptospira tipperaryensis]AOP33614.1 hypothetical protein A0128_06990 [Leptospira tipperaryensis]
MFNYRLFGNILNGILRKLVAALRLTSASLCVRHIHKMKVFLFSLTLVLIFSVDIQARPEIGSWLLGGSVLHIYEDETYYIEPNIAGGGACRGQVRKEKYRFKLFRNQCEEYPMSGNFSKPSSEIIMNCFVQETSKDLMALAYLVCHGHKRYPSISRVVPAGSIRKAYGVSVRILKGRAKIPVSGVLFTRPSESASKSPMERFNMNDGTTSVTAFLPEGYDLGCVAVSTEEYTQKGEKGKWYYVSAYDEFPSYALHHYGWFFSSVELICSIPRE